MESDPRLNDLGLGTAQLAPGLMNFLNSPGGPGGFILPSISLNSPLPGMPGMPSSMPALSRPPTSGTLGGADLMMLSPPLSADDKRRPESSKVRNSQVTLFRPPRPPSVSVLSFQTREEADSSVPPSSFLLPSARSRAQTLQQTRNGAPRQGAAVPFPLLFHSSSIRTTPLPSPGSTTPLPSYTPHATPHTLALAQ